MEERVASLQGTFSVHERRLTRLAADLAHVENVARVQAEREVQRRDAIVQLAITSAEFERATRRRRVMQDSTRLGTVVVQRTGTVLTEAWENGSAFRDVEVHQRAVIVARDAVEAERKALKRRIPGPGGAVPESCACITQGEYTVMQEAFDVRVLLLKKEEAGLQKERERLERDKTRHLQELKRIRDEDCSRFNQCIVLGGRYVLQHLLGRGGFSEVHKAYDVEGMRFVACKIHQLLPSWNEQRKRSYVRHAAREYNIMKQIAHDCIVSLFDVFEIDNDSFCTVLGLCEGEDLEARLKVFGTLSEREARVIVAQIFSGLAYLSSGPRRVIHFDLKPGNILFDKCGRVKITDFGLSKIMEENAGTEGLELTSQGAGTYWYLPPECFETGVPPRISSKVDVWSVGVIFYQMLYGRRPFGHALTQEKILREETILRAARTVVFPTSPAVTAEAQAFIRRCLTYAQSERPDAQQAAADPYLNWI